MALSQVLSEILLSCKCPNSYFADNVLQLLCFVLTDLPVTESSGISNSLHCDFRQVYQGALQLEA
jgi:hypothetical protein